MNFPIILFFIFLIRQYESIQLCPYLFCNSTRFKSHCQIECSSTNGEFPPLGSSKFKTISKIAFSNVSQIPAFSFRGKNFWEVTINSENLDSISDNAFCEVKGLDSLFVINPKRLDIFYSNSVDCLKVLIKNFFIKSAYLNDSTFPQLLEKIKTFSNLANISLSDTNIKSIELTSLSSLIHFSVVSSPIENFNLSKNLRSMKIAFSNLTKLKPGSFDCSKLRYLNLSHNKVEILEKGLFPINLENLYLNNNRISRIENDWIYEHNNLKILDLSFNLIEYLPLENFYYLEHLNAQSNMIKNLNFFSKSNFDQLKILILSDNKINDFSSFILKNLKNLTKIDCSINLIENLQFPQMDYLKFINFSNNRITYLNSRAFSLLSSLEVVDLSFNQIKNFEPIFNSKFLEKIILANNFINKIPSIRKIMGYAKPNNLIVDLVANNVSHFNNQDLCDVLNFVNITFIVNGFFQYFSLNESKKFDSNNKKLYYSKLKNIKIIDLSPLPFELNNFTIDPYNFQDQCLNITTPITLSYSRHVIANHFDHSFNGSNSTEEMSKESKLKNFAIFNKKFNILIFLLIIFTFFNFNFLYVSMVI